MIKEVLDIDTKECEELSLKYFSEISGMNRNTAKAAKIKKGGLAMRQKAIDALNIKTQYIYLGKDEFDLIEDKLIIGSTELTCQAFSLISKESVEGLYLYGATAGNFSLPDETPLKQVYLDLWGTAYIDAIRYLFRNRVSTSKISESFGPGFYGMPVTSIHQFKEVLDFDELNIRINSSNIMIPVKSCCGLFFAVNDKYTGVGAECLYCMNSTKNCKLCSIHTIKKVKK